MLYTIIFVLFLGGTAICKNNKTQSSKTFIAISFFTLFIVSACRFQLNSDMSRNYMHTYEAKFYSWNQLLTFSVESLNWILRKIVITVFRDPQAYFFVTAAFIILAYYYNIQKYAKDIYLGIILFFICEGFFPSNNITRQYIAIAICLLNIKNIIEEKPVKYTIYILFALGFHLSAIVSLPLYFLSKKKFTMNLFKLYLFSGVILVVFNNQATRLMKNIIYSEYDETSYGASSSNVLRLVWPAFVIICLMILYSEQRKCIPHCLEENERQIEIFNNLISHGAILYVYFSLLSAVNSLMFSRVAVYFTFYSQLIIGYGIYESKIKQNKKILVILIWSLCILWFTAMNYAGKFIPTPYTPFWEYPSRLK